MALTPVPDLPGGVAPGEAPEPRRSPQAGPVAYVALELRTVAREAGVSRSVRRQLAELADTLDGCAYTADMHAALSLHTETLAGLHEAVAAQEQTVSNLAAAQGMAGQMIGQAVGYLSSLHTDVDDIKAEGLRRWLRRNRKAGE